MPTGLAVWAKARGASRHSTATSNMRLQLKRCSVDETATFMQRFSQVSTRGDAATIAQRRKAPRGHASKGPAIFQKI